MKGALLKRFTAALLAVSLAISIAPRNVFAVGTGSGFGDSASVIHGASSSDGIVTLSDTALLRVSVRLDTKQGWEVGYEQIHPANDTYSIILGNVKGERRSNSVVSPVTGNLGQVNESDNIFWGDVAYPEGIRGAFANAIWELFMSGHTEEYNGDFTSWLGTEDRTIRWQQYITPEQFAELGLSDTSILEASNGTARLSIRDRKEINDEQAEKELTVGGLIIAAYMKIRGQDLDLNEVAGALTGKNDKRLTQYSYC